MATPTQEPWPIMETEQGSNLTTQERVQEMIREKVYRCLHRELPYNVEQTTQLFKMGRDAKTGETITLIHQDLIVYTKSHARLVHGTGGRTLTKIRETAIRDLEPLLNSKVNLHLNVKLIRSKNKRQAGQGL